MQAIQSATVQPARYFGVLDSLGTAEVGKVADLVLLDADPLADIGNTRRIAAVVLRGSYLDRSELDGLLKGARRFARRSEITQRVARTWCAVGPARTKRRASAAPVADRSRQHPVMAVYSRRDPKPDRRRNQKTANRNTAQEHCGQKHDGRGDSLRRADHGSQSLAHRRAVAVDCAPTLGCKLFPGDRAERLHLDPDPGPATVTWRKLSNC